MQLPQSQHPSSRTARCRPINILDGMLEEAATHQRQGRLPEAERLYRRILTIDPTHAPALHLLGTLAREVGRLDVAAETIRKAIAIDPRQAAYHSNLGAVLQAQGGFDQAAACYEAALALSPQLAEAHMNLGTVLHAQGLPEQAAARFRSALALKPNLAEAHMNLGNALQAQGRLAEALTSHQRALRLRPDFAEACFNSGNILRAQGKFDEAVASYRRALELRPGLPEAHANMGTALEAQQRIDEAAACYEQAIALKPDYAEAHYNLGNARQAQDLLAEAQACYRRALELKPQLAEAHYNLGNTLQMQEHLEDAAVCFEQAIAVRPDYAQAHYNLGCVRQQQGRAAHALPSLEHAVCLQPANGEARFGLALAQLQCGDFAGGWPNYEARWQSKDHDTPRRNYAQPRWDGRPVAGGRLLLWGEQGVGDEIMFAGLLPAAIGTGSRIVLECDPRLQPLFSRSFPEVEVLPRIEATTEPAPPSSLAGSSLAGSNLAASSLPTSSLAGYTGDDRRRGAIPRGPSLSLVSQTGSGDHESARLFADQFSNRIAVQLPTASLPGLFRTTESAFAAQPAHYLKAHPGERDRFRDRYCDGRPLIGLAWRTRNQKTGRKRSIPLSHLLPLLAEHDLRWISLQYGDFDLLEQEISQAGVGLPTRLLIDRTVDQFTSIDRFASQVAALDHVVCIDNSTAHLAAALGVPVSLMLPYAADWRWRSNQRTSPWYPSMQIFRQPAPGEWAPVVAEIRAALRGLTSPAAPVRPPTRNPFLSNQFVDPHCESRINRLDAHAG
jgi:tetratricopeptide (TPR) repeat protein